MTTTTLCPMKITQKQKDLLFFTRYNRGSEAGEFYCELGSAKPFSMKTVQSLVMKKLVSILRQTQGAVYLVLTPEGQKVAKPLALVNAVKNGVTTVSVK
jgi:DNA-binding MarR family transcriptional regulator